MLCIYIFVSQLSKQWGKSGPITQAGSSGAVSVTLPISFISHICVAVLPYTNTDGSVPASSYPSVVSGGLNFSVLEFWASHPVTSGVFWIAVGH